jgi:hypothetical protein
MVPEPLLTSGLITAQPLVKPPLTPTRLPRRSPHIAPTPPHQQHRPPTTLHLRPEALRQHGLQLAKKLKGERCPEAAALNDDLKSTP